MASHVAIMGFCNSVPYVQRQMDLLLKDLADFCRAYCDDIVVAGAREHSVSLEPKTAYLAFPKVSLLGQRVDALGMTTPEDKIKAIVGLEFPRIKPAADIPDK
ncbi:hypothetical protein N7465_010000 [Penicillium sp. CMV-2018d]|nr:hypothetical protein N7465_010000 [Penicillium sp. CMV-2018d]